MTPTLSVPTVRLIYKSRSALEGTASDIERGVHDILQASRRRNSAEGVTGALMFTRLLFVQALEGPADAVERVFDRISCDLRHTGVEIIEYRTVDDRGFGTWSMSHVVPDGAAEVLLQDEALEGDPTDVAVSALKLMATLVSAPDNAARPRGPSWEGAPPAAASA